MPQACFVAQYVSPMRSQGKKPRLAQISLLIKVTINLL